MKGEISALPATVAVAVSPAPEADLAQVLEDACSEVVRPSRCVVEGDGSRPPDVVVTWMSPLSVRVAASGDPEFSRTLDFRDEDPKADVFRSVGLVAAALVNRSAANHPSPDAQPPAAPEPRAPVAWLEGGAVVGSGLERGPVSFGGVLRGAYTLPPIAPVFVGAAGSYATAGLGPDGLRAKWTMLSADAGVTFQLGDVALRPRLSAVFAQLVAEAATGPAAGTSGSRRLAGASAAADAVWPASERFSLVLGAEGTFLSSGTSVRLGGERTSAFPALEYRFFLGIQAALLR